MMVQESFVAGIKSIFLWMLHDHHWTFCMLGTMVAYTSKDSSAAIINEKLDEILKKIIYKNELIQLLSGKFCHYLFKKP